MTSRVPEGVVWMRSSTSTGDDAVEIARLPDGGAALRRAGDPDCEPHVYTAAEWEAFVKGVDAGEFDLPE
ncbi:MAG TPA: DUF397 domain-containing protein [Pseudonocardia sp.]|jgi:hypothetical protein|nr:DUF397 domain-containing protein [Pseudonocardia sp.]